ncbi:hypothetical protein NHX12_003612 [Muraenolepis orangiensis]|uniref:Uncharacterized protein n=1 Tax=Muraenolepis orangiensis TaxID=630683 RepID=A0A9Q0DW94_9TELE|nr:hypothetical protein NHX12_003612 [Muraenolepis orangiensis]
MPPRFPQGDVFHLAVPSRRPSIMEGVLERASSDSERSPRRPRWSLVGGGEPDCCSLALLAPPPAPENRSRLADARVHFSLERQNQQYALRPVLRKSFLSVRVFLPPLILGRILVRFAGDNLRIIDRWVWAPSRRAAGSGQPVLY